MEQEEDYDTPKWIFNVELMLHWRKLMMKSWRATWGLKDMLNRYLTNETLLTPKDTNLLGLPPIQKKKLMERPWLISSVKQQRLARILAEKTVSMSLSTSSMSPWLHHEQYLWISSFMKIIWIEVRRSLLSPQGKKMSRKYKRIQLDEKFCILQTIISPPED